MAGQIVRLCCEILLKLLTRLDEQAKLPSGVPSRQEIEGLAAHFAVG
jgi:hypothetical protein